MTELVNVHDLLAIIVSKLEHFITKSPACLTTYGNSEFVSGAMILHSSFTLISKSDIWYLCYTENIICFSKNIKITFRIHYTL